MIREETIFVKHDKAIKLYEKIFPETFLIFNDINYPDIYKFQNVSFGFKEGETVKIDEPVFIVNGISQYIHFLTDCIGPYLFIKQYDLFKVLNWYTHLKIYTSEDLKCDKKYSCNSTSSISYSFHIFGDISKYFTLGSESNIL